MVANAVRPLGGVGGMIAGVCVLAYVRDNQVIEVMAQSLQVVGLVLYFFGAGLLTDFFATIHEWSSLGRVVAMCANALVAAYVGSILIGQMVDVFRVWEWADRLLVAFGLVSAAWLVIAMTIKPGR